MLISEKQYDNFVLLMLALHLHFESIFITLKIFLFKVQFAYRNIKLSNIAPRMRKKVSNKENKIV